MSLLESIRSKFIARETKQSDDAAAVLDGLVREAVAGKLTDKKADLDRLEASLDACGLGFSEFDQLCESMKQQIELEEIVANEEEVKTQLRDCVVQISEFTKQCEQEDRDRLEHSNALNNAQAVWAAQKTQIDKAKGKLTNEFPGSLVAEQIKFEREAAQDIELAKGLAAQVETLDRTLIALKKDRKDRTKDRFDSSGKLPAHSTETVDRQIEEASQQLEALKAQLAESDRQIAEHRKQFNARTGRSVPVIS